MVSKKYSTSDPSWDKFMDTLSEYNENITKRPGELEWELDVIGAAEDLLDEKIKEIKKIVDDWEKQYIYDDENGASVNPFYMIEDLRKVVGA